MKYSFFKTVWKIFLEVLLIKIQKISKSFVDFYDICEYSKSFQLANQPRNCPTSFRRNQMTLTYSIIFVLIGKTSNTLNFLLSFVNIFTARLLFCAAVLRNMHCLGLNCLIGLTQNIQMSLSWWILFLGKVQMLGFIAHLEQSCCNVTKWRSSFNSFISFVRKTFSLAVCCAKNQEKVIIFHTCRISWLSPCPFINHMHLSAVSLRKNDTGRTQLLQSTFDFHQNYFIPAALCGNNEKKCSRTAIFHDKGMYKP